MKVIVDRLNGMLSITLAGGPSVRTVTVGADVMAGLDRYGRLIKLDILRPFSLELKRHILPRLAAQFHVPVLAHMDPSILLGDGETGRGLTTVPPVSGSISNN
jgi:hypothetical protein